MERVGPVFANGVGVVSMKTFRSTVNSGSTEGNPGPGEPVPGGNRFKSQRFKSAGRVASSKKRRFAA